MKRTTAIVLCALLSLPAIESSPVFAKKAGTGNLSAAQRHKLMEIARGICKRKYGAASTVWRLDYKYLRVTCQEG